MEIAIGYFHHEFRLHLNGPFIPRDFQGEQPLSLPPQHIIGQPLKRLSQHDELAAFSARISPNHPASPLHKWQYLD